METTQATETPRTLTLAAVQAAPVFMDRDATAAKACELIAEAGRKGADIVAFPEGYIPSHPLWFHLFAPDDSRAKRLNAELYRNSVEVPGPVTEALGEAARAAGCYVVMGICERDRSAVGTLYNTLVFIGPDGRVLGKHQKLVPTGKEKLIHSFGRADTFMVVDTDWGGLGGLMCAENQNHLARQGMLALGETIHVAAWPAFFGAAHHADGVPTHEVYDFTVRSHAYASRVFAISSAGAVDRRMVEAMGSTPEARAFLEMQMTSGGGSAIYHPSGRRLAGPLIGGEGILYAEARLDDIVGSRLQRDLAGNYNRFDIFHLTIDRRVPPAVRVLDGEILETE